MRTYVTCVILALSCMFLFAGCSEAQKTMPHTTFRGIDFETRLDREDITVLSRVEGDSTTTSILFGVIQVIDGEKLRLLGIPFYTEKYTYWKGEGLWPTTQDRAYYKALEKQAEADVCILPIYDYEKAGIPFLWDTETVTFQGKAIKVREDS